MNFSSINFESIKYISTSIFLTEKRELSARSIFIVLLYFIINVIYNSNHFCSNYNLKYRIKLLSPLTDSLFIIIAAAAAAAAAVTETSTRPEYC